MDDAANGNDEKGALVELILLMAPPTDDGGNDELRVELSLMKLSALRRRAVVSGIGEEVMEEAADGDDEKSALVQLLSCQNSDDARLTELRSELSALKLSALRRRAVAQGVNEEELEAAADGDDEQGTLIAALLAQPAPTTADDRPHFGTGKQLAQRVKAKSAPKKGLLPPNKHAMISYQWDDQERVVAARETLTKLGVPCWMVIDGGMQQDIYESMAEGVERAACVVCFLSQKYQDSVSAQAPSHHNLISKGCF